MSELARDFPHVLRKTGIFSGAIDEVAARN